MKRSDSERVSILHMVSIPSIAAGGQYPFRRRLLFLIRDMPDCRLAASELP